MMESAKFVKPLLVPPLHPEFVPAALVNRAFLQDVRESGCSSVPLVIALERGDHSVSVYRTKCFAENSSSAGLNLSYAERLVKMLLWQRSGWKVTIGGPRSVGLHVSQVYSAQGARAFDANFMGSVYEHPFTVEVTEAAKAPEASEGTVPLGGHFDGCRIGFDLGATDRKVAAVIEGNSVYSEEVVWDPRNASDPNYHFSEINIALRAAAEHLPRVDAIGGSAAGIYLNNRPRVASLFRGVPTELFESKISRLFLDLQAAWGGIPFVVVNDGEVTALAGALALGATPVLGVALGSSQAGGYVDRNGEITTWLNELAFCPVDYDPQAPIDEWSGDRGCGGQYFSQQAVFRLAQRASIELAESLSPADKLKTIQELLGAGDERTRRIFETIGIYLGYSLGHYADFYELRHVLILGRVTSGDGGNIILNQAREVLKLEFRQLSEKVELHLPDESSRRVGQAVAAASLPRRNRGTAS